MMADPGFSVAAAHPVATGHVFTGRIGRTVGLRTGQDVMTVRHVSAAGNSSASFVEHCRDGKPMSHTVELTDAITDEAALGVMPWAITDAIARIDCVRALRAEVGTPRTVARSRSLGQTLAERVGSIQTSQIGPSPEPYSQRKGHRVTLGQGRR